MGAIAELIQEQSDRNHHPRAYRSHGRHRSSHRFSEKGERVDRSSAGGKSSPHQAVDRSLGEV